MAIGEASIHIARPPAFVFDQVGDAANNPRWRKNVVRTEWLDDGPMRVGRRGRQTTRLLGREWTVEAVVDEWDPPRHVAWRTVAGPVKVRSWYTVEPEGDGTRLTGGAEGAFTGPLGGLLTRLAVPRMLDRANKDLEALRVHLESSAGAGARRGRRVATGRSPSPRSRRHAPGRRSPSAAAVAPALVRPAPHAAPRRRGRARDPAPPRGRRRDPVARDGARARHRRRPDPVLGVRLGRRPGAGAVAAGAPRRGPRPARPRPRRPGAGSSRSPR